MSLLDIVSVVFVFSILVLIHELGHYLAARWMGVRVEKFSIGFPPTIFSKKLGDTEFCISAIPLGGYVKMAGFVDESMDTKVTGADDEYSSKPVWKRIIIITAGVIMNLVLAIVIYTFLSYSQGERINPSTEIRITGESGIAERIGFKDGDKILEINQQSINDFNQIFQEFFDNMDNGIVFTVLRSGEQIKLSYDKEWLKEPKGEYLDIAPVPSAIVGDVAKDMPASETGLQTGDLIVEMNKETVKNWDDMTEIIRKNAEKTISIKWERNGQIIEKTITPKKVNAQNEQGEEISYGLIGIGNYYIQKPVGFGKAIVIGLEQPFKIIYLNIKGIWWWMSGIKSAKETIGGPVMIAKLAGEAAERGWVSFMNLIGALSAVLAFFNLLPIPALDGGHLSFLFIEAIMGKPLSIKTRLVVQQVGMALLLTFIIFVLYVDINRLFF